MSHLAIPVSQLTSPDAGVAGFPVAGPGAVLTDEQIRAFSDTLSSDEVVTAITAVVGDYLPLSGGTLTGELIGTTIVTSDKVSVGTTDTTSVLNVGTATISSTGGICFGGDTYLYRVANGNLRTAGSFSAVSAVGTPSYRNLSGSIYMISESSGAVYVGGTLGGGSQATDVFFKNSGLLISEANLLLRKTTTTMSAGIYKTYTSDTNCEYLSLGFSGTYFDVVSRVGTAGGTNRPIRLGHLDAASTFTGLTVATSGNVTIGPAAGGTSNVKIVGTYSSGNTINLNNAQAEWANAASANPLKLLTSISGVRISNGNLVDLIPISGGLRLVVPSSYTSSQNSAAISGTDAALTCGAITASSTLTLQNSTTAVWAELSKTHTSSTNREYLYAGFSGTYYDLCSRVGSAGGTNQPIRLGHLDAASTFTGLTVATDGTVKLGAVASASNTGVEISTSGGSHGLSVNANILWISSYNKTLIRNNTTTVFDSNGGFSEVGASVPSLPRGVFITPLSTAYKALVIKGVSGHTETLIECKNSSGTTLFSVGPSGAITPATLTDAAAPNGSIYYSSTASKLVYKDAGGTVNNLY